MQNFTGALLDLKHSLPDCAGADGTLNFNAQQGKADWLTVFAESALILTQKMPGATRKLLFFQGPLWNAASALGEADGHRIQRERA